MSTTAGQPTLKRHPLAVVRGVLVAIAGALGIICVISWVITATTGLSLIVVTTGSMSPTIPAGSVVVSERVPATSVRTGQIVTVPRPGASLPVTHRVVTVEPVAGDSAARQFTLRGDANETDDRDQYVVREAGLVLAAAPALGSALQAASTPAARGLAVAVVGLLVTWTFWPARTPSDQR
jgi:signal peptidase